MTELDNILIFPETSGFRRYEDFFTGESVQHPAKANLEMLRFIIERYSNPGELICDPMAGTFSTAIMAGLLGRNGVGVEYEEKFYRMGLANKERFDRLPLLTAKGSVTVLKGDARELSKILKVCDEITTSPPYENQIGATSDISAREKRLKEAGYNEGDKRVHYWKDLKTPGRTSIYGENTYSDDPENLGNQKGATYLGEMKKAYGECFKVLKDGGLMILITKNFVRGGKQIRLDLDTIKLCESVGFRLKERFKRKLTNLSFWQINHMRKYLKKIGAEVEGNPIDFIWRWNRENPEKVWPGALWEDILVFEKPLTGGLKSGGQSGDSGFL